TTGDSIYFIYTHSFNSGSQWSPPVENLVTTPDISITLGEPGDALIPSYAPCPAISSFDNFVHLVWQDSRDDSSGEIYYKRSMDSGQVWSSDIRLTTDSAYSICPTVASSGNSVYIGWLQKEKQDSGFSYYIKNSTDGGTSWDSSVCLVPETENLLSIFGTPQVNTRDNFVTVIYGVAEYDSSEGRDIAKTHLKYSNDNGLTWNSITFGVQGCVAYCPSATIDNSGNSHIVWTGGTYQLNTRDVYYAKVSLIAVEENSNIKYQNVKMKIIKNKIFLSVPNNYYTNTLITIYDLSGRLQSTLYSGTLSKGDYTFTPNIHKSGIYFVQLTAGNIKETKKLILVR
ncbi:MAG: T9SS type A sorting domain-containing protein, partial [bacterium]|nr:T9SS type A sorting domain-containing protein [bacterium]